MQTSNFGPRQEHIHYANTDLANGDRISMCLATALVEKRVLEVVQ